MSTQLKYQFVLIILLLIVCSKANADYDISATASGTWQLFAEPADTPQHDQYLSISIEPELHYSINKNSTLLAQLFARIDQHDENRTHNDIRELYWQTVNDIYELRIGISKVFWGATESQHLVDIINQTDNLEGFDGEDKLGQPMVKFSVERDWGNLDFFILPYFRPREYPGTASRLRLPLPVDTRLTSYESDDEDNHIDYALRYFITRGNWDIGMSYFTGTAREPFLQTDLSGTTPVFTAHYPQLEQTGIDLTGTVEDWIYKLELVHRHYTSTDYYAATAGFEYTFYGVMDSDIDIGLINEYLYDGRKDTSTVPFQKDLMLGLRFNLNNEHSTTILTGFIIDVDDQTTIFSVEASRRIANQIKAELEIRIFTHTDNSNPVAIYSDDDYIRFNLNYYF